MTGFLLAEYHTTHETLAAAAKAAEAGMPAIDVLSPNALEGIAAHLAPRPPKAPIGWVMVIAGGLGALLGYGMQWYSAVIDYPINSGGRGLNSWPAFLLVPYETAILSAAVVGLLGWLWLCGLPRPHHALFAAAVVERASQDRFLLVFNARDRSKAQIEHRLQPHAVYEIDA
ncbi:MAG TPA: quinol:electron acceptor oxidoreductase subunit ActD [Stellaceae bacterium]|nr:quinol:electron acceptor oxidoreductase subunit ActD [Stellaceae bacterium]